jgi:hypothetical protein
MKKERQRTTITYLFPTIFRIGFGTFPKIMEVAKVSQGLPLHLSS